MNIFRAKWDWQKRSRKAHGRASLWVKSLYASIVPWFKSSKLLDGNSVSRYCTSRFFLSPLLLCLESLLWRRRKSSPFRNPESRKSRKVSIQRLLTKIQVGASFHLSNRKSFLCLHSLILTLEGLGEFETVMQTRDEVEGLHNCREFSQPLECLYQDMQTQEKSSLLLL